MINWIISSSVLIIITVALRLVLKGRISLRLQYALWLIVLVRLLFPLELGSMPFSLSNTVQQIPIVQEFEDIQDVDVLEHLDSGAVLGYSGTPDETAPLQIYDNKTDEEFTHINNALKFRDIAVPLWQSGSAVIIAVFIASNLHLARKLKKFRTLLCEYCDLPVYITDQVETPCLFGFFSPAIYVTPETASDETFLRHTLEHELTHFRHWDQLWAILRCAALALHWYNPLVWLAAKLSRNDAELACDEATLLRLGEDERAAYGRTLIQMTCQGPSRLLTTATTMTGSKGTLKERISLIAEKPKMAVYTLIAVLIIAVTAALFTFTGSDAASNRKLHNWMQTVTADEIAYAYISEGYGTATTSYTLNSEFRAELARILNNLKWNQFGMDQHAGAPERRLFMATGAYLDWDEEFIFGIREDGKISISFTSEFGEEISKPNKGWYVTSPELSSFINDILDGKTSLPESSDFFRADLDYDGEDEIIRVDMKHSGEVYTLQVSTQDGTLLWEGDAALPHMGWTTYMLYQDGTSRGILNYTPAAGQGLAGYNYQVHFLDGNETPEYLKGEVSFPLPPVDANSPFADYEYDPMEVIAFLEDINYLMEHSVILLSTEGGELIVGPESPQFLIDDNMELVRQLTGQNQQPYDVADEMKKVKASDITELGSFNFTADEIASALNSAASNKITASVAANRGFSSENHLFWEETAYLEGNYETGISGANLALRMDCGLAENIIKVTYGRTNLYSTGYFESEELYTLLRYRNQPRYGVIDQEALKEFRYILTNQMDFMFNMMKESNPIYAYELIEFNKAASYKEADGALVEVYDFDYGLLTDDPEGIGFAGGMHFDGWLRLRGFNGGGQLAVRYRDGKMTSYAFLGNDFSYHDSDSINYPEYEDIYKEHLKNTLDFAETPPMYTDDEIRDAIQVATRYFDKNFKGCELKAIEYGGDDMSRAHMDWATRNNADEVIVLISTFVTDSRDGNGSLNPDTTYVDWKWILVRDDGGEWKHADHGY